MKTTYKHWMVVGLFVAIYVFVRSGFFVDHLNFSTEQADFAAKSMDLWQNKKIELIGPAISFRQNGREIFQGSSPFYFQLLFLLPTNFDPVLSSYLFMIFGALMLVPLYFGVLNLADKSRAVLITAIYTLFPLYIDYSRFLWNPNFQFVLTPLSLWILSRFIKSKKISWILLLGIFEGFLTTFHYQYVLVIALLCIYLFFQKMNWKSWCLFFVGIAIGFSPIILFELRHDFYNIRTMLFFLQSKNGLLGGGSMFVPHYYLSISLFVFFAIITRLRQSISTTGIIVIFLCMTLVDIKMYFVKPANGFGMAPNWNFRMEEKAYTLITRQRLEHYNIANLIYNTKASVQKYLHKINGRYIDENNYETNKYLFVITDKSDPLNDPAYEVSRFAPATKSGEWVLNEEYKLYLYQRN